MATGQQPTDPIESVDSLKSPYKDAEQIPLSVDNINEHPPNEEKQITPNTDESKVANLPRGISQLPPLNTGIEQNVYYPLNYGPQTQTFFYGGYKNPTVECEEYSPYKNAEGLEVGSAAVYNENQSFPYHSGYGFQLPYGLFSPATTRLPSVSGDGQLCLPQQFPFSGGYYQQPAFSSMPFISSAATPPVSQTDWTPVDQQGAFIADASSTNNMLFGQRISYQPSFSAFSGDWLRSSDGTGSMTPILPPATSLQPTNAFMSFGQSSMPTMASGMASQQRRSYGFGSASSFAQGYLGGVHHGNRFGGSASNFGVNGKNSTVADKSRRQGRGNGLFYSCDDTPDFLKEHNRGPRANKFKDELRQQNSSVSGENTSLTGGVDHNLYNRPDFITEYKDAKFFVIKSFSEDNVHKSIKYGVWASTSYGNKKLNFAYREAKAKGEPCPVFLFFSVNASAHFCGLAEMVGPVDFEKSVDYWQKDKWNGQFPVKWHIVKDISNSMFRYIILENNDNKPVTHSRDAQEVKFEQGMEMLRIFAKHEYEASILDDLEFYEEQEKAMLEKKARNQLRLQQLSSASTVDSATASDKERSVPAIYSDCVNQISMSFADAVRLKENSKEDSILTDESSSLTFGASAEPEDPIKLEKAASDAKSS